MSNTPDLILITLLMWSQTRQRSIQATTKCGSCFRASCISDVDLSGIVSTAISLTEQHDSGVFGYMQR